MLSPAQQKHASLKACFRERAIPRISEINLRGEHGAGALPMPPKDQKQKNASGHTSNRSHAHEAGYISQVPVHLYYVSANAF
jgi:hypothetical protein